MLMLMERTQMHPNEPKRTQTHPNAPERTRTHPNAPERTQTHPLHLAGEGVVGCATTSWGVQRPGVVCNGGLHTVCTQGVHTRRAHPRILSRIREFLVIFAPEPRDLIEKIAFCWKMVRKRVIFIEFSRKSDFLYQISWLWSKNFCSRAKRFNRENRIFIKNDAKFSCFSRNFHGNLIFSIKSLGSGAKITQNSRILLSILRCAGCAGCARRVCTCFVKKYKRVCRCAPKNCSRKRL